MIEASASVIIKKPVDQIFGIVSDIGCMDKWIIGLSELQIIKKTDELIGTIFSAQYQQGGQNYEYQFEIDQFHKNKVFGFKSIQGMLPFQCRLILEDTAEGVQVTSRMTAIPNGKTAAVLFFIFGFLFKGVIAKQQRAQVASLQGYIDKL